MKVAVFVKFLTHEVIDNINEWLLIHAAAESRIQRFVMKIGNLGCDWMCN